MCFSGKCKYEQPMSNCTLSECLAALPKTDAYSLLAEVLAKLYAIISIITGDIKCIVELDYIMGRRLSFTNVKADHVNMIK